MNNTLNHPRPLFLGFTPKSALPIKAGDTVTVPKGTPYRYRGEIKTTKTARKVTVHHVGAGYNAPRYNFDKKYPNFLAKNAVGIFPMENPSITWAGSGGYWADCDINYVIPDYQKPNYNPLVVFAAIMEAATAMDMYDVIRMTERGSVCQDTITYVYAQAARTDLPADKVAAYGLLVEAADHAKASTKAA